MAKRRRTPETEETELNLAPIMNMVVILIPLLLLSVVFLKVGVIDVSMPSLSPTVQSDVVPDDKPALNLTVAIDARGFRLVAANQEVPPLAGCPASGPTLCLSKPETAVEKSFRPNADEGELDAALAAYNWTELYNQLVRIKKEHGDETTIHIAADANVPYAAIVRVMDVARLRLAADSYNKPSEFWSARYAMSGDRQASLFPDPVLTIAR